jgi:hypothetical protein
VGSSVVEFDLLEVGHVDVLCGREIRWVKEGESLAGVVDLYFVEELFTLEFGHEKCDEDWRVFVVFVSGKFFVVEVFHCFFGVFFVCEAHEAHSARLDVFFEVVFFFCDVDESLDFDAFDLAVFFEEVFEVLFGEVFGEVFDV